MSSGARHLSIVLDEPQAPEAPEAPVTDLAVEIEQLIRAARYAERRGAWNDDEVCVPRPRKSLFGEPVPSGLFPIATPVGKLTVADLRAIADRHDAVAGELRDDAQMIRGVADQLSRGGLLAARIARMGREHDERATASRERWDIARGEGGVYVWEAVSSQTRWALFQGGILTVAQVRAAVADGSIYDVKGIGKRRLAELHMALQPVSGERRR